MKLCLLSFLCVLGLSACSDSWQQLPINPAYTPYRPSVPEQPAPQMTTPPYQSDAIDTHAPESGRAKFKSQGPAAADTQ